MDIIQNVKDEIIKPPDELGPVRFGHLMFDADFESGNLGNYHLTKNFEIFISDS